MKSSFVFKSRSVFAGKKIIVFFLVLLILFSCSAQSTEAQLVVANPTSDALSVKKDVKDTWWNTLLKSLQKAGSVALQRTLSSALNKIAYDTANWIGSGGSGQKPLFVTQSWGSYLTNIGDEAAGQFIETFAGRLAMDDSGSSQNTKANCDAQLKTCQQNCANNAIEASSGDTSKVTNCFTSCTNKNTSCASNQAALDSLNVTPSFSVCSPSSLEAKLKITLGLVDQNRPAAPDCTASQMIKNWDTDINKKISDLRDPNFLNNFATIFDPRGNDLGIYVTARADLATQVDKKAKISESQLVANKGWLDVRNIAGMTKSAPGTAERQLETALAVENANIGKFTGDALVDASSVFLNQLALSAFNKLLQSLGDKATQANVSKTYSYQSDPNSSYSQSALEKITMTSLQPKFNVLADYDILSQLVICTDPKNPGPDNCVIDNDFMQAVTENKTVAEAIKAGYLHGDWQFTIDNSGDSYHSSYSLRNISILRKYRILPVGWEEAVQESAGNSKDPKKVTLNDLVACFDSNDWCHGLVDPNWVLKAPLNYCKKQGVGAQILSKTVTPETADSSSTLNILRSEDYCADNETCIKEKGDGKCEAYGYCNEEKRTWNFGNQSCQPINNTCRSFTSTDSNQSTAYLENTLNYGECTADNSGCRQYSFDGTYATSTGAVSWNVAKSLYFNKKFADCDSSNQGCTQLMRVKPTWGSNLVMNADFGNDSIGDTSTTTKLNDWPIAFTGGSHQAAIIDAGQETTGGSGKALKLEANGGSSTMIKTYSDYNNSLLPKNLQAIPGVSYTLSADVYLASGDRVQLELGPTNNQVTKSTEAKNSWQHLNITANGSQSLSELSFAIAGYSSSNRVVVYVQNIKLEMSDWETSFSPYGSFTVNQKLIPAYLEKTCYADVTSATKDYSLKSNAPAVCSNFARKCNKEEVGCDLFTSALDSFSVPAKTTSGDYCPKDCVGYDIFIAKPTFFRYAISENLIPKNSTTCSAEAVGCTEFTNLDAIGSGGEQKEYYTSLKQCIKPDTAQCSNFYSWSGEGSGYQLKSYSLKKAADGQPAVTGDDSTQCNQAIFNLPVSDPGYNPDCQEFYNAAGQVYYHLISRTITCSDDCHTYRMTENNANNNCLNGGTWDTTYKACLYHAIPGEGQTCQANENGCREYNGSRGSNVKLLSAYDFENGISDWSSNCAGEISASTVSNSKNGHSMYFNGNSPECSNGTGQIGRLPIIKEIIAGSNPKALLKVGNSVSQGSSYSIKFLARSASNTNVKISFLNPDTKTEAVFNSANSIIVQGGNKWQVYEANLNDLGHEVSANELLTISGNGSFYIDNIVLSEITDRYYLIQGSSQVPDVCYYDNFDNYQGADYNLGCSQYTDRAKLTHNLRQFNNLCSDSAVGCEQMIDTQNYSKYGPGYWQDGHSTTFCTAGDPGCLTVGGDTAIYAVYDETKLCSSANKGCSRLGQAQGGENITSWSDVYKLNDPDNYSNSLCDKSSVGCEEWRATGSDGNSTLVYFKNPGTDSCVYRAGKDGSNSTKGWYKVAVKRCGGESAGSICSSDSDCPATKPCVLDNNDYPCSVSFFKTIGLGGAGNQVPVPDKSAGLCDGTESGCTEYIDPVSQFSPNLVFNPSFKTVSGVQNGWGATSKDKWNGNNIGSTSQIVRLEPNKLYSLDTEFSSGNGSGDITLEFNNIVRPLINDNSFGTSTKILTIVNGANKPIIFSSLSNSLTLLTGGDSRKTIKVRELAIDYQLDSNIDKKSCNGQSKFDNGCVMFNERSVSSSTSLAVLNQDAYATVDGAVPTTCDNARQGSCTANIVAKVKPDRVCSKWLDCTTYINDPSTNQKTCYALGECDRLDEKNECAHFTETAVGAHRFEAQYDKNTSGYALLDQYNLGQMKEVGGIPQNEAQFNFEGGSPEVSCRSNIDLSAPANSTCPVSRFVSSPSESGTDYPAQGVKYLKVPANRQISPLAEGKTINLKSVDNQAYFINYLVNTKNSAGLNAKVIITDGNDKVMSDAVTGDRLIFVSTANSGWERKIAKFTPGKGLKKIRIYLTSDTADIKKQGFVYFDDINIEPVLEIGPEKYAARECRIYPTSDSLTCSSKSTNVIQNGLEGYCLQHDPANPSICSLWYPVDKISSAKDNRSTLGYNGKFPLNYCSEVNGNFTLVEKRLPIRVATTGHNYGHVNFCIKVENACGNGEEGNNGHVYTPDYDLYISHKASDNNHYSKFLCVPKADKLFITTEVKSVGTGSGQIDMEICNNDPGLEKIYGGWAKYDGFEPKVACLSSGYGQPTTYCDPGGPNKGLDESKNVDDGMPVRVYDYNNPPTREEDLKYLAASNQDGIGENSDKIFRLTCNKFVQTVNADGENKAWTERFSDRSLYPTTTPNFFFYSTSGGDKYYAADPYRINNYGYNNSANTFGAASWPDNFDISASNRIPLRNVYSSNNSENIIAGRPYGCSNGNGSSADGCSMIGACNSNPDVYCLAPSITDPEFNVADKTCGESGSCQPLWSTSSPLITGQITPDHPENILRSLFLSSYATYGFNAGTHTYTGLPSSSTWDYYNGSTAIGPFRVGNCVRQGNGSGAFCAVYPILTNVKLYYNNNILPFATVAHFNINQMGIYRLEFNSKVDPEQQPLKRLEINWGDGNTQIITGQDEHPITPHVFYHYYSETGAKNLDIKAYDNWGVYAEFK